MNILLANIGNRNIKFDGKFIDKKYLEEKGSGFYEETKFIFENIEEFKNDIEINILNSILDDNEIDKIYLFTTNQGFHQDTYYEAKILEYILKSRYTIEIVEKKDDPRRRDEAFKFFEKFFNENKDLENHNLIISGSGGVPAMKEALNFYSVIKFKNANILDVDEVDGNIFKSEVDKEYLKNFDKNILVEMIKNYDYNGAYIFLKNSRINSLELENYCIYLSNRYNFNFEKSNKLLNNFKSKIVNKIKINNDFISIDLLFELFDNIEISYEKGEKTMMLGKVYSLYENLIKYIYEDIFGHSINDYDKLKENGISFSCNEYDSSKQYPKINSIKDKIKDNYKYSELFNGYNNFFFRLYNLKENRNNSIVAHGLGGVDNSISQELYDLVKIIKEFFGIKINIYHEINKELLSLIK